MRRVGRHGRPVVLSHIQPARLGSVQRIEEPELTPDLIRSRAAAVMHRLRTVAADAGRDPDGFRLVFGAAGFTGHGL